MRFIDILRWFETGKIPTKAERFLRQAEVGNAVARLKLGLCYYKGDGVPQDDREAIRLFRLASQQGNAKAQFYLGRAYGSGGGVSKNLEQAYMWFELAAAQGDKKAAEWKSVVMKEMTPEQIAEGNWLVQEKKGKL